MERASTYGSTAFRFPPTPLFLGSRLTVSPRAKRVWLVLPFSPCSTPSNLLPFIPLPLKPLQFIIRSRAFWASSSPTWRRIASHWPSFCFRSPFFFFSFFLLCIKCRCMKKVSERANRCNTPILRACVVQLYSYLSMGLIMWQIGMCSYINIYIYAPKRGINCWNAKNISFFFFFRFCDGKRTCAAGDTYMFSFFSFYTNCCYILNTQVWVVSIFF